jgi:hypothetical protein
MRIPSPLPSPSCLFDAPNDQQNDDRRVGTELGAA